MGIKLVDMSPQTISPNHYQNPLRGVTKKPQVLKIPHFSKIMLFFLTFYFYLNNKLQTFIKEYGSKARVKLNLLNSLIKFESKNLRVYFK